MSTVYLNGRFMPLEQATVSVLDRGFNFADGVYRSSRFFPKGFQVTGNT